MKKLLNKITVFIFGVECYPDNQDSFLDFTPSFKSSYPEGYDPHTCEGFNSWANTLNVSCQYNLFKLA